MQDAKIQNLANTLKMTGLASSANDAIRMAGISCEAVTGETPPDQRKRMLEDFKVHLADYHRLRDFPAVKGTSFLSVHLRFGTISIRELARVAHTDVQ